MREEGLEDQATRWSRRSSWFGYRRCSDICAARTSTMIAEGSIEKAYMIPIRRSRVIPNHVPPTGLPRSRPDKTHGSGSSSSSTFSFDDAEKALESSNVCQCAGRACLSKYSSRLDAKILRAQAVSEYVIHLEHCVCGLTICNQVEIRCKRGYTCLVEMS